MARSNTQPDAPCTAEELEEEVPKFEVESFATVQDGAIMADMRATPDDVDGQLIIAYEGVFTPDTVEAHTIKAEIQGTFTEVAGRGENLDASEVVEVAVDYAADLPWVDADE